MSTDSHPCPAVVVCNRTEQTACGRPVAPDRFACSKDWFRLPKEVRDRMWRHYRSGNALQHAVAMVDARVWFQEHPR